MAHDILHLVWVYTCAKCKIYILHLAPHGSDTRDLPGYPPDMSGPTGYTGDSLASDLVNRSAAGTDWEWVMTIFGPDLVTVNSHIEAVGQDRHRSRSSVQTLVRSHNIKSTHRRPLVIPPRFDTDIIKVSSPSHLHEHNSHASYTCPCTHGIRPFGLALDT